MAAGSSRGVLLGFELDVIPMGVRELDGVLPEQSKVKDDEKERC